MIDKRTLTERLRGVDRAVDIGTEIVYRNPVPRVDTITPEEMRGVEAEADWEDWLNGYPRWYVRLVRAIRRRTEGEPKP